MTENTEKSAEVTVSGSNSDALIARVRQLIGTASARSFARTHGIAPSTLQSVLEGKRPIVDNLVAIARAGGVTVDWLATGEGPMRAREAVQGMAEPPATYGVEDLPDSFVLLPRYEVRAAAGGGSVIHSEQIVDHLAFKRDWITHQLRRNPAHLILIEAVGDSMEPTIANRDLLLVDTTEGRMRDNAIYAISVNGELLVKRLQRRTTGAVVVMSDNDRYRPEELGPSEADQLQIVGQVVWHGGVV